jgi:DNA topoisomerase-2
MADNIRSIPSMADGLKPGQRKVIFAAFKKNLVKEIKVAQLAGYVSEKTAYHHGEVSLTQTIVGLAQNYVGSNNINLLEPSGQFGTRNSVSIVSLPIESSDEADHFTCWTGR